MVLSDDECVVLRESV